MSSALVFPDLRSAARANLLTVTGLPMGRAWEGRSFDPVAGQPWLREQLQPVYSNPMANGTIEHLGLYVISLFYPVDDTVGTRDIEIMAGRVIDAFKVGKWLGYGSISAISLKAERRGITAEPAWLSAPVIVRLQTYSLD